MRFPVNKFNSLTNVDYSRTFFVTHSVRTSTFGNQNKEAINKILWKQIK